MRSHLFVVTGPNGAGKTTFLRLAANYADELDIAVFQKETDRPTMPGAVGDRFESRFVTKEVFAQHRQDPSFWTYRILDDEWGFDVEDLRSLCAQHRNVVCSIPSPGVTRRVQRALPDVRVIRAYVYADEARRSHRIAHDNATAETQEFRRSRAPRLLARYRRAPFEYDHVILNIFDEATFARHVRALLLRYNTETVITRGVPPVAPDAQSLWLGISATEAAFA